MRPEGASQPAAPDLPRTAHRAHFTRESQQQTVTMEPWKREHLGSTSGSCPDPACPALPDQGSQTATGRRTWKFKCMRSSPKAHRAPASEAQQVLGGAHSSRGDGATWPPRGGRLHPPAPSEEYTAAPCCTPAVRAGTLLAPEAALQGALWEAGPNGDPACRHQDTGTCIPTRPFHLLKTRQAGPLAPRP